MPKVIPQKKLSLKELHLILICCKQTAVNHQIGNFNHVHRLAQTVLEYWLEPVLPNIIGLLRGGPKGRGFPNIP